MESTSPEQPENTRNNAPSTKCPVCLSFNPPNSFVILPCEHLLCKECMNILTNLNNKCPLCNKEYSTYITTEDNQTHSLTLDNMENINKHKREMYEEENFECITRDEVYSQLQMIEKRKSVFEKKMLSERTERLSDIERKLFKEMCAMIEETYSLLELEEFEGKIIAQNINNVIIMIKQLEKREWQSSIGEECGFLKDKEQEDEGYMLNNGIEIEIGGSRKNNKKRKKKR